MKKKLLKHIWAILCKHVNGPENHRPLGWTVDLINGYLYSPDDKEYLSVNRFQTVVKPSLLALGHVVGTHPRGIYACTKRHQAEPTILWYQNRIEAEMANLARINAAIEKLPA
jgi:hypothetical protein